MIHVGHARPAVETVEFVRYDETADPAELAAWCGGTVRTFPWDKRPVVVTAAGVPVASGHYLVKRRDGTFHAVPAKQFETEWQALA